MHYKDQQVGVFQMLLSCWLRMNRNAKASTQATSNRTALKMCETALIPHPQQLCVKMTVTIKPRV